MIVPGQRRESPPSRSATILRIIFYGPGRGAGPDSGRFEAAARLAGGAAAAPDLGILPFASMSGAPEDRAEGVLSDGAAVAARAARARALGAPLLFGYVERAAEGRFLAAQLVLADGRAVANARASHLGAASTESGLIPGQWLTLAPWGEADRLGLLLDHDLVPPEPARALALLGATLLVVLVPAGAAALAADPDLGRVRALENGLPVVVASDDHGLIGHDARGRRLPVEGAPSAAEASSLQVAPGPAGPPAVRRPELYRQLAIVADEEER